MWTKNSESVVENSMAYYVEQTSSLNFFKSQFNQDMILDTKIGLNLENEIDFSSFCDITSSKINIFC